MDKRMILVLALTLTIAALIATPAQACACAPPAQVQNSSLGMTASLDRVAVGEPVTFTITKTNVLPSDQDWSVRDHLPTGVEFVSATSSQGTCALQEGSNVVQCDLGIIPSGGTATMDIAVVPTVPGDIANYAADNGQSQAAATVTVE